MCLVERRGYEVDPKGARSHMVLRSALAHRLQNHVWIRGSASNHYLQIPARLRLQFSSVARSTSFCVLFAALSLTEVTDRDTSGRTAWCGRA